MKIKKFLQQIFSVKNNDNHKIVTLLGFKIKFSNPKYFIKSLFSQQISRQTYINSRLLTAFNMNEDFKKYKGCNRGKNVVLIAAGSTVNDFTPIKDAIYVGCNRAFLFNKVKFDYLFAIDKVGINKYFDEFFEYEKESCIKFIGDQNMGKDFQIPENLIPLNNTHRYVTNLGIDEAMPYFPLDISTLPLYNSATVSIQAMQFILYTQPQKIYIVGVDCTCGTKQHFIGNNTNCEFRKENVYKNNIISIESYKLIKDFAQTYYPQTEIISVNPIGLKGIFKDVYTKAYIEKNKEIINKFEHNLTFLEE